MKRSEGERVRLDAIMWRARNTLDAIDRDLRGPPNIPIGLDSANALSNITRELMTALVRLDAYQRAEDDTANEREPHVTTTETTT